MSQNSKDKDIELRKQAEKKLLKLNPTLNDLSLESKQAIQELELSIYNSVSSESILARQILYELQLHQIELEMQNEELRKTQIELDNAKEKYFNLYNLAPIGYLTLSEDGLIIEANLTAVNYFKIIKNNLLKESITNFILFEDQDIYYLKRKCLIETKVKQQFDIRMIRKDNLVFWVELIIDFIKSENVNYTVIIKDISDRKSLEDKLKEYQNKQ